MGANGRELELSGGRTSKKAQMSSNEGRSFHFHPLQSRSMWDLAACDLFIVMETSLSVILAALRVWVYKESSGVSLHPDNVDL